MSLNSKFGMTNEQLNAEIEIQLPGEDLEPPEYEMMVDFGEKFREEFSEYRWDLDMLSGANGQAVSIPTFASCIESAFRIYVAGTLTEADFPQQVYDVPEVNGDFVLTDKDLGNEEIAVTVTATPQGNRSHEPSEKETQQVSEHWHINLTYELSDHGTIPSEKISNPRIMINKL
jgi:hypothetical protein